MTAGTAARAECPDRRVAAVVVHHRSPQTVLGVVADLRAAGLPPDHVVVVDNSDDADWNRVRSTLASHLADGVRICHVDNRGYGAAVNAGVDLLAELRPDAVLVCTHEVHLLPGCVRLLVHAIGDLTGRPVVASGPILINRSRPDRLWSCGGWLSPRSMVPWHYRLGRPVAQRPSGAPVPVHWLDGACVLYDWWALARHRFDERYFLYFEEVDLHTRLRADGDVVVVPGATALQSTGGVPPYYLLRNYLLFTQGRLRLLPRIGGVCVLIVRWLPSARRARDLIDVTRGLLDGRRWL